MFVQVGYVQTEGRDDFAPSEGEACELCHNVGNEGMIGR